MNRLTMNDKIFGKQLKANIYVSGDCKKYNEAMEKLSAVAKPILFNTEMVRAILDGRKTVTRRVIKPQPERNEYTGLYRWKCFKDMIGEHEIRHKLTNWMPQYNTGDYLYVRETWGDYDGKSIYYVYRADYPAEAKTYKFNEPDQFGQDIICDLPKWRPSIHMPKEAARIFLRVTNVKAERLQEIDKHWDNYRREGVVPLDAGVPNSSWYETFIKLWDSTIKKQDIDRYGWTANPWVWVIEFERVCMECKSVEN